MKIIKSFLLVTRGLCTTTLLQAQEIKTEILKPTAIKPPPAATITNIPSPAPQLNPMNGVAPKEAPVAATQAPSPLKKDENKSQPEDPKTEALTIEANGPKNNLTAEQLKTLNGIAEKPKQTAPAATLDAPQNIKPAILLAPAAPLVIKNENQ